MNGKLTGWLICAGCLALLALSATPYAHLADHILIAVRLALVLIVSVVIVAEKFHAAGPAAPIMERLQRWYRDEPSRKIPRR